MYCRVFSGSLRLCPLDVGSTSPLPRQDNQKCLKTLPNVSWGPELPQGVNRWPKSIQVENFSKGESLNHAFLFYE